MSSGKVTTMLVQKRKLALKPVKAGEQFGPTVTGFSAVSHRIPFLRERRSLYELMQECVVIANG